MIKFTKKRKNQNNTSQSSLKLISPYDIKEKRRRALAAGEYQKKLDKILIRCDRISGDKDVEQVRKILQKKYSAEQLKAIYTKVDDMIEDMKYGNQILLRYDYGYKFTKSKKEYTKYFAEGRFIEYIPGKATIDKENFLSFVVNKQELFKYMSYGDQLTRITFSPEHLDYDHFRGVEITDDNGTASPVLLVDKNYSMSNPYVLKALILEFIKKNDMSALFEMYKLKFRYARVGFAETVKFIQEIEDFAKGKNWDPVRVRQKVGEILPEEYQFLL